MTTTGDVKAATVTDNDGSRPCSSMYCSSRATRVPCLSRCLEKAGTRPSAPHQVAQASATRPPPCTSPAADHRAQGALATGSGLGATAVVLGVHSLPASRKQPGAACGLWGPAEGREAWSNKDLTEGEDEDEGASLGAVTVACRGHSWRDFRGGWRWQTRTAAARRQAGWNPTWPLRSGDGSCQRPAGNTRHTSRFCRLQTPGSCAAARGGRADTEAPEAAPWGWAAESLRAAVPLSQSPRRPAGRFRGPYSRLRAHRTAPG